jgi:general secretion pathway protein B
MSFILDALRKSEIERQRQNGPSIAEFPVAREDRRLPIALIAIGFLLAVNLAVILFFLLRDEGGSTARPAASAPAPVAAATATGAAATPAPQTALQSQLALPAMPEEPPAIYYDDATLPPDAPDPTLMPDAPAPGADVTYGNAPAEEPSSVVAATGLLELSVDLHVFAADPAKRAVFINGRRYTQGAQIAEGPVVEEITRDGAVLTYRGRRFVLPRL